MTAPIEIIELPSNLGLKEPIAGKEPGVKKLPGWLKKNGLYDLLKPSKISRIIPPPYSMHFDDEIKVRNADAIIAYAHEQVPVLRNTIRPAVFTLVIGGDCSILIGTALALKQLGNYALFYLDGHTDYMLPQLSATGGVAGMDLAIVTGSGHPRLTNIDNLRPYFIEENVWCVGNREYDKDYVAAIENSNLKYYDLNNLRNNGIENCINSFLSNLEVQQLDGFWIHLDVDVLDDELMPAVDSRTPGGLSYSELSTILVKLISDKKCAGLEITILDPDLDPLSTYTAPFVHEMSTILKNGLHAKRDASV
jgi:arginase